MENQISAPYAPSSSAFRLMTDILKFRFRFQNEDGSLIDISGWELALEVRTVAAYSLRATWKDNLTFPSLGYMEVEFENPVEAGLMSAPQLATLPTSNIKYLLRAFRDLPNGDRTQFYVPFELAPKVGKGFDPGPLIEEEIVVTYINDGGVAITLEIQGQVVARIDALEAIVNNLQTLIVSGETPKGVWNASTNTPNAADTLTNNGDTLDVTVGGNNSVTGSLTAWAIGDKIKKTTTGLVRIPARELPEPVIWVGSPIAFDFTARTVTISGGRWVQGSDYYSPLLTKNGGSGGETATINMVVSGSAAGLNVLLIDFITSTYYCVSVGAGLGAVPSTAIAVAAWQDAAGTNLTWNYQRTELDAKFLPLTGLPAQIVRMEENSVFAGSVIDTPLSNFLLDFRPNKPITTSGTQKVHLYYVWRGALQSTGPDIFRWVVAVAIDETRIMQFAQDSYIEPAADANGKRISTLTLAEFGGSGYTATAVVDWSALTNGQKYDYVGAGNYNRSLLSGNAIKKAPLSYLKSEVYTKAESLGLVAPIAVNTSRMDRIETNNVFYGIEIENRLRDFLIEIRFNKPVSLSVSQKLHVMHAWRNWNNGPGVQRWLFSIAIDETRICQFFVDNVSPEPAADANGKRISYVVLSEFGGSGYTAIAIVDWSALTDATSNTYSGAGNYGKGLLSPNVYMKNLGLSAIPVVKQNLPSTASPNRLYTTLNDLDNRNTFVGGTALDQDLARSYGQRLFVDKFLKSFPLNVEGIVFEDTLTDKWPFASVRKGDNDNFAEPATPSVITAKTVKILGGTLYNDKTINFSHVSTRESIGADALIASMDIGDSTIHGLQTEVGVPVGFACRGWAVKHEQMMKRKIDYLINQGYSIADIQANNISNGDKLKYRFFQLGTESPETYTLNYRGVTLNYSIRAEGRGGWGYREYINKPVLMQRSQGTWDVLGLGNGSGTDYTGSAAQTYLFDRTAFDPNAAIDTAPMRAWALANLAFTGATLADYKAKFLDVATNPTNPYFDKDYTGTVVDSSGNTWQIRFSMAKYLSRWRTMTDAGVRLAGGDGSIGTLVGGNLNNYDVFRPTHIIIQSCQNDQNVAHFGQMAKALATAIKNEYTANTWGIVNIGLAVIDGSGTYFPKKYSEISGNINIDESQRAVHNDNLTRLLTEVTNEDANHIFVIADTFIIPSAKSVIYRSAHSPEYEITQDVRDSYVIPSRTSVGIKGHINGVGHRALGIHHTAWIIYTLGL